MNDQDLDTLLKKLNSQTPHADQIQKWKSAVRKEQTRLQREKRTRWMPLAFAAGVGFALGSFFQLTNPDDKNNSIAPQENATIEFIYIKK